MNAYSARPAMPAVLELQRERRGEVRSEGEARDRIAPVRSRHSSP